jgi:putative restriction endonuclease
MAFLEMSRDAAHGGQGWEFGVCLWSPTIRRGGGRWGYWELMRQVSAGSIIVHLRGKPPKAAFVAYSTADADCYETSERPPEPGEWSHASSFYRVPLRDFVPLTNPVSLEAVFSDRRDSLLTYHQQHSPVRSPKGRLLFFVQQDGRLQCQNGAYLSELDSELSDILFPDIPSAGLPAITAVNTGQQVRELRCRIGQRDFSLAVRENFGHHCCFPGCSVQDASLLVGAHIARWADSPQLRGHISNGLCLCLFHDRLFELGAFTLSGDLTIRVNSQKASTIAWAADNVAQFDGHTIRQSKVAPCTEALNSHWMRIGFSPQQ